MSGLLLLLLLSPPHMVVIIYLQSPSALRRLRSPELSSPLWASRSIGMFRKSFNSEKCKGELRMAMARIKVENNARGVGLQRLKAEVAALLRSGQDVNARVKVEHVIREENALAAYGLISIYCESILPRLPDIQSKKVCPTELKEPISGIIFASPRCADISELSRLSKKFGEKYGKEFTVSIMELRPNCGVSSELIGKLSNERPGIETKLKVLFLIASKHGIEWQPKSFDEHLHNSDELLSGPTSFENAAQSSPIPELNIATSKQEEISSGMDPHQDHTTARRPTDGLEVDSECRESSVYTRIPRNVEFSNGIVRSDMPEEIDDEYDDRFPDERGVASGDRSREISRHKDPVRIGRMEDFRKFASSKSSEHSSQDVNRCSSARGRDGFVKVYHSQPVFDDSYDENDDAQLLDRTDRNKYVQKGLYHVESDRGYASTDSNSTSPSRYDHGVGLTPLKLSLMARSSQQQNLHNGKVTSKSSGNRHLKMSSDEDDNEGEEEVEHRNSKFTGNSSESSGKRSTLNSGGRHGRNDMLSISDESSDDQSFADTEDRTNIWKNQLHLSDKQTPRVGNLQPVLPQRSRAPSALGIYKDGNTMDPEMVSICSMRMTEEKDRSSYLDSRRGSRPRDSQELKEFCVPLAQLRYDGKHRGDPSRSVQPHREEARGRPYEHKLSSKGRKAAISGEFA